MGIIPRSREIKVDPQVYLVAASPFSRPQSPRFCSFLQGFKFTAAQEQLRPPRVVRVGIIQNAIVLPTTVPYADQRSAIFERVTGMIGAAAACGANIVCLQVGGWAGRQVGR